MSKERLAAWAKAEIDSNAEVNPSSQTTDKDFVQWLTEDALPTTKDILSQLKEINRKRDEAKSWLNENNIPITEDAIQDSFYEPASYDNQRIRVKFLDGTDIESLGGKLSHEEEGNPNKMYYFGKHSLIFNYKNGWCIVTVRSDERQEDYTAYVGVIKNKSELKRLFDNLGVSIGG